MAEIEPTRAFRALQRREVLGAWPYVVGVSTEGMGVDTTLTLAGTLALAPLDRRAAMRRDRNLSAICLGTSTDLIKLISAPWTAVN